MFRIGDKEVDAGGELVHYLLTERGFTAKGGSELDAAVSYQRETITLFLEFYDGECFVRRYLKDEYGRYFAVRLTYSYPRFQALFNAVIRYYELGCPEEFVTEPLGAIVDKYGESQPCPSTSAVGR